MKRFSLPEETLNAVLQYLGTRPFVEVEKLVAAVLNQSEEVKDEAESDDNQ